MLELKKPLRVVMVDDDPDDIFITKMLAKRSSVPVDFKGFESGSHLFKFIKNNGIANFDVILIDINMPIENGYAVLKKLQAYPHIDEIALVMFSTSKRPDEKQMALELGANEFIIKPSNFEDANQLFELIAAAYFERQPVLQVA